MRGGSNPSSAMVNGDRCIVRAGKHAGKSGVVRDRHTSATGQVTITVEQADGTKFKTLARNVSTQIDVASRNG
jgi:ribosomal protein S4E